MEVHCLFSFVMENPWLRQLEFIAGSSILDPLGWSRRAHKMTNSNNQKNYNPQTGCPFLSCCNKIFLVCQICKNFNGKLGFSTFFPFPFFNTLCLRASHDRCTNKWRNWIADCFVVCNICFFSWWKILAWGSWNF